MKFKALLGSLAGLALASTGLAQTRADTGTFSPEAFRAHVAFLADDLLEGREAGTRGYDIGARYVAAQFEALGLRPAADGSWFQPVQFVRYSMAGTPRLTVGGQTYAHGEQVLFRPSPSTERAAFDAPAVFAGYGLDLPGQGFNDYANLDVRGKVVVVLTGTPRDTPSDVAAHLASEKRRMAAARGAVGLIMIRRREEMERTPWSRYRGFAGSRGTTWLERDGAPFSDSNLRFSATVDAPVAEALFAGSGHTLDELLAEAQDGRPAGFALRHTVAVDQDASTHSPFTSPNVVAVLPGTDPSVSNEYVLLMAHLDGLGVASRGEGDRIRNGAMDNATGVATLIEVARRMTEQGNRPRRPILLAAVTAEEVGLLGAEYLARHPVVDGRIVSVVNLDMPILTYDFRDVIAFGAEHSTMGPIVERAASRIGVRLAPDPLPQEGLFTRSDHYKFVREGVPAVFLMTGFGGEGRERFTGFLSSQYHSPADDLSLPFDWEAGAKFAQLNYLIASEIANAGAAPRWYADSFFGTAFGGEQPRARRSAP